MTPLRVERLLFGGTLTTYTLRPRNRERASMIPWAAACVVALIVLASWAPIIRQVTQ